MSHLKQVSSLSLRHDLSDPLQTGIRFLLLPLPPPPWPLIARRLPVPCGEAMSGVYLVSLHAPFGGSQTNGVRDSLSTGSQKGTMRRSRQPHPDSTPFGHSSAPKGETSVSCSMITMVKTRVHITFPIPFTSAIFPFLAHGIGTNSHLPCVLAHGSFNCSSAPPNYSGRTYS